jgi:23S rRNA pseudouridine1911/1915/1917 synthase
VTGERVFSHTVRAEEGGERLDKLLADLGLVPSRAVAQRLIDGGSVTVEGEPVRKSLLARPGDFIEIDMPPPEQSDLIPEDIPLDIRFEDDHLIVLSKAAGMVVHPAHGNWTGTLVHALLHHSEDLGGLQGEDRPGIVHRLDKDTSGLMLVAKDDDTQRALQEQIRQRLVDRRYLTLVQGVIVPDTGMIDAPIARAPKDRMKMAVSEGAGSRQAVTSFRVLERYEPDGVDDGYTLADCKLQTGRTHQIRVHMDYIHHPVVGDPLYGPKRRGRSDLGLTRQFLHSYRLRFIHPVTDEEIELFDWLPHELAKPLAAIEDRSRGRTPAGDEVYALPFPGGAVTR